MFEKDNIPEEVRKTLINFLGHTYQEVTNYDSNIVSPNQFLAPKKFEFQRTAEKVLSEAVGSHNRPNPPQQEPQHNRPFIDTGVIAPPVNDPNQLEFSFDNSVTAKTINKKLEDIENVVKRLDTSMKKVLELLSSNEVQNSK